MRAPIDVYAASEVIDDIKTRFGYVFDPLDPEATTIFKPWLVPHALTGPFRLGTLDILPFDQDHGYCRTTGFRFGRAAYTTDAVNLPEDSLALLGGLDLWVVGCLGERPHPTHAHLDKVLAWVERLRPKLTVISHMAGRMDYGHLCRTLPAGVIPAYDGLVIEV
jgi:phosphoribosyl 1,2-cyclic phosphate phosphodiesterase